MDNTELPCAEKLAYDSENEANAAATTIDWQRGITLRPYKCRHCGLWHLTSHDR